MTRSILRLAIPNIIANITIPLLGMVDLALMGHLGSEVFIGAVALGTVIFNFIYWGSSFLRMSTSGFTAQAYGRKDHQEEADFLFRSLLISLLLGVIIIILQNPIVRLSFFFIKGSQEVETLARSYFSIRIWAAPATLCLYAISGWLLGMQNARLPMILAIMANIFNLFFSIVCIKLFGMKSDGVALGTVMAQYLGIAVASVFLIRQYKSFFPLFNWKRVIDWVQLRLFFKVNTHIFIRSFCIIVIFAFFTSESASTNNSILAVNSMLLQFLLLFSFFIDGFAFAGESLTGKFIGQNNPESLKKLVRNLFFWGGGLALAYSIIYLFAHPIILLLLTNNKELIDLSAPYLVWVILIPVFSFGSFIWDGIYIGATASKAMRNTMLAASLFVFAPSYFLLKNHLGNHALWLAMSLFMLSRGLFQTLLYRKSVLKKSFYMDEKI